MTYARPLLKPNVVRFHHALEKYGLDLRTLYARVGLSAEQMADPQEVVPISSFLALLEEAARMSRHPYLGMEIALQSDLQNVGTLKYLVANSNNLAQALNSVHRFVSLVSPGAISDLRRDKGQAIVTYSFPGIPADQCRQDVEGTLMQFVMIVRELLMQADWQPDVLYLEHSRPEASVDNQTGCPLGCEIIYDHTFSGVAFTDSLLAKPFDAADADLYAVLEAQAALEAGQQAANRTLTAMVVSVVTAMLGSELTSAGCVARQLNMSERTLHRKLRLEGQTFKAVRDEVVLRIAKQQLLESDASVLDIALSLGYADATGFIRYFSRRTGRTPLQFRKEHLAPALN